MEIVNELPAPRRALDYEELSRLYNQLPVGKSIRMDRVSNITMLKAMLENRGVKHGTDFEACHRNEYCYVTRKSTAVMG